MAHAPFCAIADLLYFNIVSSGITDRLCPSIPVATKHVFTTHNTTGACMELSEIIGYIGATATTVSFIPQAIKVIRTRDTRSISLWMYLFFSIGVAFWLVYGILKSAVPIVLANAITLLFAVVILYYKLSEKPSL